MSVLHFVAPWTLAVAAVIAYFCGCFNGAVIISKYILHDDIRNHGSGNAGLTNFWRTFGGKLTLVVILLDVVKAIVAVLIGVWIITGGASVAEYATVEAGERAALLLASFAKYWSGLFCLLGHMFPCMFGFKGGKGILSGGTIAIMIDWRIALVVWGGFILLTALTRWVSLGSCWAGATFPIVSWFVYQNVLILLLALVIGGLILWKHRGNIRRLLKGEESKLTFHKKK